MESKASKVLVVDVSGSNTVGRVRVTGTRRHSVKGRDADVVGLLRYSIPLASVAGLEQLTLNQRVAGSSPAAPTIKSIT